MKLQTFLEHHGVQSNPFAEEEAQTDPVFKEHCIHTTYHPSWDKIYGNPREPSTSIVLGEKGAGKTALRLQMVRHLHEFNQEHPEHRVFLIEYDDFNPFLDRFQESYSSTERMLKQWKLWDHIDAILCLGLTRLIDGLLGESDLPTSNLSQATTPLENVTLTRPLARDFLLLAACYDQALTDTFASRWHRLKRLLHYTTWRSYWDRGIGFAVTLTVLGVTFASGQWAAWLTHIWVYLLILAGWAPYLYKLVRRHWLAYGIVSNLRVGNRVTSPLRKVLMELADDELSGQPLPRRSRSDDRYEMLLKFQRVLAAYGYQGLIVFVDRVDEPTLMGGLAERMKMLLWPLFDNKFLKQPGLGVKMLLPAEIAYYLDREESEFMQRSRLDKQNLIRSLEWTGEALYDVAEARLKACAKPDADPKLRSLFHDSITDQRLLDVFWSLRVPRNMFQFIYRLLVCHCNAHTDSAPVWKIQAETFESTLALFRRDQENFERNLRAV